MQTHFSLAQLADPDIAEAEKILRACVHCGFCTATCPTYVLLGDELDSPRGRIYLIKDMLEKGRAGRRARCTPHRPLPVLPVLHDHLPVRRALHAPRRSRPRPHREAPTGGRWRDRLLRALLAPRAAVSGAVRASRCGRRGLARPVRAGCWRRAGSRRMAAMLTLAPAPAGVRRVRRRRDAFPAEGQRRMRSRCSPAAPSRCCAAASTRRRSALLTRHGSRWCRRRARAAAARWSTTWAARTRRSRRRAATSTPGRASSRAAGSTPSSSTPRAAAPRSRTTASCCATTRATRRRRRGSSALAQGHHRISRRLELQRAGSARRPARRLSLGLLAAARPADRRTQPKELLAGRRLRGQRAPEGICAAARPAPTTSCSPNSPDGCATRKLANIDATGRTWSPPAISAASRRSPPAPSPGRAHRRTDRLGDRRPGARTAQPSAGPRSGGGGLRLTTGRAAAARLKRCKRCAGLR